MEGPVQASQPADPITKADVSGSQANGVGGGGQTTPSAETATTHVLSAAGAEGDSIKQTNSINAQPYASIDVNKLHSSRESDPAPEATANGNDSSTHSPAVEPMQPAAPDSVMSDVADAVHGVSKISDSANPQQHSSTDPAAAAAVADADQQQQQHDRGKPSDPQPHQSVTASAATQDSSSPQQQKQQQRLTKLPSWVKRLQNDRSEIVSSTKAAAATTASRNAESSIESTAAAVTHGPLAAAAADERDGDDLGDMTVGEWLESHWSSKTQKRQRVAAPAAAMSDRDAEEFGNMTVGGWLESHWLSKTGKRPRVAAQPTAVAAAAATDDQQQQQHALPRQHSADHSHIRKHHAVDGSPATAGDEKQQQQQQRRREGGQHKRPSKKAKGLLSFQEDDGDDESASLRNHQGSSDDSDHDAAPLRKQQQQQQRGSLGAATANRFKQEAKQAAAAAKSIFKFKPSAAAAGSSDPAAAAAAAAAGGSSSLVVDDDGDLKASAAATAGLSQVHFGFATARGHRPYMEDRHTIITTLNPSAAAALAAAEDVPAAAAANGSSSSGPAAAGGVHDGVGRSYAAIFDGHNGAGAAETAARKLHLLLASHPALRIYRGEQGPPAVVKQEEHAVGQALKAAFRQIDDLVLGVARRDGIRDGATALVVLRLGHALYAAHAGDSRAVLCRDAAAYRLTEDHKPHLPQERSRIEEAGGRVDFQRCWRVVVEPRDGRPGSGLAVSRSLGDLDFKEPQRFVECDPDVTRLLLLPKRDTFIVLGSDGLWDVLSDTDAIITAATALRSFAADHGGSSSSNPAAAGAISIHTGSSSSIGGRPRFRPGQFNLGLAKQAGATADLPENMVYSDAAATAAAEALLAESMRRGTMDNVTVIVMLLQWG